MTSFDEKKIDEVLNSYSIPCQPKIIQKIIKEFSNENPDMEYIGLLINSDVSLSGAVLQAVNSSIYKNKIKGQNLNTIDKALSIIDKEDAKKLIKILILRDNVQEKQNKVEPLENFWKMSSYTAAIAAHLAQRLFCVAPDDAYSLGLFRDCGIPIMMHSIHGYREFIINYYEDMQATAYEIRDLPALEDKNFGINHQTIGYCMAVRWSLPEHIQRSILLHEYINEFNSNSNNIDSLISVVQIAELIANNYILNGFFSPDDVLNSLNQNIVKHLDINPNELIDIMVDTYEKTGGLIKEYMM